MTKTDHGASRPTRRQLLAGAATLAAVGSVAPRASASDTPATDAKADFLFVQTAQSMAYEADRNRLTLTNVSPVTLYFSDRPERIAGNMTTERFVPFWSEGKDSFLSDNPNADLSVMIDGKLKQVVVILSEPELTGSDLHYTVEILDGDMPVLAENASLFIDVIGMPLSPLSVAGVRRREFRRAVLY